MQLIIAEKKLAAYAYARALSDQFTEKEGFLIGDNQILYTWAQGHLLKLMEPGEIQEEWEVWSWDQLPILPTNIPLRPIKNQERQLYLIQRLAKQASSLVNGMDCAGEGELIFHEIVRYLKLEHIPTKRLWTASLQSSAIREAYHKLRNQEEFLHLRTAAFTRNRLDYLTGINTSRSLTLVGDGQTLAMGRLIGSCLSLVHLREEARANFEEESYYSIKGQFKQDNIMFAANYSGEKITAKEKLDEVLEIIAKQEATLDFTDQIKEQLPPILLNHTDVLVIIYQRYGIKPKQTSRILEGLYIKGLISYPRTDARFVTKDEIIPMRAAFRILSEVYPNLAKGADIEQLNPQNERLVNKVSDHHALIPTLEIPRELKEEEKWVYQLILERFFLQVQSTKKTNVRSVAVQYTNEIVFKTTFQIIIEPGWKGLALDFSHEDIQIDAVESESEEVEVQSFPAINKTNSVKLQEATTNSRTTKPPAQYTEGTLIKQMENVSNVIDNPKYKKALKGCGIGTSATRAETIQKIQDIGYVKLEKKKLIITPLGESVLGLLNFEQARQILSPEMTALWEIELEDIKQGKPPEEFEKSMIHFIQSYIVHMKELSKKQVTVYASTQKCPVCENNIKTTKKTYRCSKCDFYMWRTQYFKQISPKMLDDLLKKGETASLTFTSKDKKSKYKAKLKMPVENGKLKMAFL